MIFAIGIPILKPKTTCYKNCVEFEKYTYS